MARKEALLITISKYKAKPLPGADNDRKDWKTLLEDVFGFTVVELPNEKATRPNILDAVWKLLDGIIGDEELLLYCSCHGTRTTDASGARKDGIVAFNDEVSPTAAHVVFDFELHDLIAKSNLGETNAQLTVVLDCCFAQAVGTIDAFALRMADVSRFLPIKPSYAAIRAAEERVAAPPPAASTTVEKSEKRSRAVEKDQKSDDASYAGEREQGDAEPLPCHDQSPAVDSTPREATVTGAPKPEPLYLYATTDDKAAYEGKVRGVDRGLFSYSFANAVRKAAGNKIAHTAAMNQAQIFVNARNGDQNPVFDGPRVDKNFLNKQ